MHTNQPTILINVLYDIQIFNFWQKVGFVD